MITKRGWILIGIFLWGIPTGLIFSLVLAHFRTDALLEFQPFQAATFQTNCLVLLPLFMFFGVIFGLIMHRVMNAAKEAGRE